MTHHCKDRLGAVQCWTTVPGGPFQSGPKWVGNAARRAITGVQVMPFVMRRTKDQVLKDLPPKIIQDVYVEPSALQRRLYEDFSASSASQQVASAVGADTSVESAASTAPHVFQV